MAGGDVGDYSPVISDYGGADHTERTALFDEFRGRGKCAILLITKNRGVQVYAKRKSGSAHLHFRCPEHEKACANIGEPENRAGVSNTVWIENSGKNGHDPYYPVCCVFDDAEFDVSDDVHAVCLIEIVIEHCLRSH